MNTIPPHLFKRRWAAIALVASLVLNGFLGGMLLADRLKPERHDGRSLADLELRRLESRLPPEAVEEIAAELRPLAPQLSEGFQELRALHAQILGLAAAPNPDLEAIEAQLAALRAKGSALQEIVQVRTYEALLKLSPEVRQRLAGGPDES